MSRSVSFRTALAAKAGLLAHKRMRPVLDRINMRARWWEFGYFPIRSHPTISTISTDQRLVELTFPHGEENSQRWELHHIFIDDPYGLKLLPRNVRTVLDVGGNIGLFSLLARKHFPTAAIHVYEPNASTFPILKRNTDGLDIEAFPSGIGREAGQARFLAGASSLTSRTNHGEGGIPISIEALSAAIDRLGGSLDVLKLDCEGAEWGILQDAGSLRRVHHLAMEYHLDTPHSRPLWELVKTLKELGFSIQSLREAANPAVGLLTAMNTALAKPNR